MSLYTKTGDNGTTALATGERVAKTDARLEAYGTIDELNSHIGLLLALAPQHQDTLLAIQRALFTVGAVLAGAPLDCSHGSSQFSCEVSAIEHAIDSLTLPPWRGFTLPGGTQAAAQAHICRTVCRRAERRMLMVEDVPQDVRIYVNRLSDYLYALALKLNQEAGVEENLWRQNK